jgi:alginate O-acetyltransferase complex protein AlgI
LVAWLGAIGYTLQIYFDFSGYTDMAIGLGKMFGIEIPENFNFPYISTSITEFWRRWHMTLSSWFRDYVFYPLEFKRRKEKRLRIETNTLIVFFLTGLWHGASWNFVLWGLLHGMVIAVESFLKAKRLNFHLPNLIKWLITIIVLIIGWVFFRSPDLKYASQYLSVMFGMGKPIDAGSTLFLFLNAKYAFITILSFIACIPWKMVFPVFVAKVEGSKRLLVIQPLIILILLFLSLVYVISSSSNSFIYFKF